jgi:hypothetical protein
MVKIDIIATNNNMFFIASLHSVLTRGPELASGRPFSNGRGRMTGYSAIL